jgi:hypothetical protein
LLSINEFNSWRLTPLNQSTSYRKPPYEMLGQNPVTDVFQGSNIKKMRKLHTNAGVVRSIALARPGTILPVAM